MVVEPVALVASRAAEQLAVVEALASELEVVFVVEADPAVLGRWVEDAVAVVVGTGEQYLK